MATFHNLWRKLLHALGVQRLRSHWVEPGNAVTRAVIDGRPLMTMDSWPEERAAVPEVAVTAPMHAAAGESEERRSGRKGVAA